MASIELRGGLFVAVDAIALAIALEHRGIVLTAKDGALLVTPGSALAPAQIQQIRQWKRHLLAIASYVPPDVEPCAPALQTGSL